MITAIVIGLGDRGNVYSDFALSYPNRLKIVGAADIDDTKRYHFSNKFKLSSDQIFHSWEEMLEDKKIADVVIITTPDPIHFDPAIKAINLGYDVLLEKPMAPTKEECVALNKANKEKGGILLIGHILRYTQFFSSIKEYLAKGKIGDIVHINLSENVSYYHYAHSFVRGNWNNKENSSPMILAKCVHDLDVLYWFTNSKPDKISSFGGLNYFKNTRDDLPDRCTDGCPIEDTCLYYAPRIYEDIHPLLHIALKSGTVFEKLIIRLALRFPGLKNYKPFSRINEYDGWPVSVISQDNSIKGKRKALERGPYGRCVYRIKDHNVVDHQEVSILFKNGITSNLVMHGHSSEEGRTIRIDGTRGTLFGEFFLSHQKLTHVDSLTNKKSIVVDTKDSKGHGGGDGALIAEFIELIEKKKNGEKYEVKTSVSKSLISHLMAFAADKARLEQKVVDFKEFTL